MRSMNGRTGGGTGVTRRAFLRAGAAAGVLGLLPRWARGAAPEAVDVWVIHGTDKVRLMRRALDVIRENGGFGAGAGTLALKVNAAWARTPDEGANTHPELVDAFLKGCPGLGVGKVVMPEHPCNRAAQAFERSGLQAAAARHGVEMVDLKSASGAFREVTLPDAVSLKQARVARAFLEADAVVNMPVAKHHGGATLSMAMKNWMGAVEDRGFWHRNDLHQCIADFAAYLRPAWTIIDATRCMLDRGPQGPTANMKVPDLLVVSRDQVTADAWASSLFHPSPAAVRYLALAGAREPAELRVERIEA